MRFFTCDAKCVFDSFYILNVTSTNDNESDTPIGETKCRSKWKQQISEKVKIETVEKERVKIETTEKLKGQNRNNREAKRSK